MVLRTAIKAYWRRLTRARPGRRFRAVYDSRARRRRDGLLAPARLAVLAVAVALIAGGLAIGWLPGPGGFIAVFGLALLAQEFRPLAMAMDRTEVVIRKLWTRFNQLPFAARVGTYVLCMAASAGGMYVAYTMLWRR